MIDLVTDVLQCPNIERYFAGELKSHVCTNIIESQNVKSPSLFQVPEPFSGDLQGAPILFIGSNPSIDTSESFPTYAWDTPRIDDFFDQRWAKFTRNGDARNVLRNNGKWAPNNQTWSGARTVVEELIQDRPIVPQEDYAVTQAVRCKSKLESGAKSVKVVRECSERFLLKTLERNNSVVLVLLGHNARTALLAACPIAIEDYGFQRGVMIANRARWIITLGHPSPSNRSPHSPKTIAGLISLRKASEQDLLDVQQAVREERPYRTKLA